MSKANEKEIREDINAYRNVARKNGTFYTVPMSEDLNLPAEEAPRSVDPAPRP